MPPPDPTDRTCPVCGGVFFREHPAGRLEVLHTNTCELRRAEDGTRVADHDRAARTGLRRFRRPSTAAERELMITLDGIATGTVTVVYVSPSIRRRTWSSPTTT